ncbi:hypothetical protein MFKK_08550 [Halopseudomonas aestusnigri]|jgi:uncharacterized membrane protein|uniref:DUF4870 family protein n=1 Tax=Halopseudomonas TaxID=2901189 RepID=UPI0022B6BCA9|nr:MULTISPECIES: hypothetical protein [Halopseudomonas]BDX18045.1 hypothetical protein MFKK_08550 [Halopseudomonas aestusnigri]
MTDTTVPNSSTDTGSAKIVYILYLVGLVIGITGIIGVVLAYVNKDGAPDWLKSHYQFQIRTFWIGALYILIGALLSIVVIGWLVLLFWMVWLIVRCIKGMKALDSQQAHPNPTGWMF